MPYLPKIMSAKCIKVYHLGKFMSTKFIKTDYLQTFMSSLSIFCTGILVWAPKFCSQIYEKQLRKNIIYSNLRRQSLHCNCLIIYIYRYIYIYEKQLRKNIIYSNLRRLSLHILYIYYIYYIHI